MHRLQRALAAVVFPAIFLPLSLLHAQGLARLYSTEGTVEARPAGGQAWAGISQGKVFIAGEAIRTADSSRAALVGADGVMVRLNANALLEFKPPAGGGEASIHVDKGDAHFLSRDPHNVPSVTTSLVSGSIRGTEFTVSVRDDAVTFSVINGAVNLSNQFGSVALSSGEEGLTEPGKAPVKRIMVRPFDAVQWTLRYPALVSLSGFRSYFTSGSDQEGSGFEALRSRDASTAESAFDCPTTRCLLGQAMLASQRGDFVAARTLASSKRLEGEAAALVLRAALALEAGQVEEAARVQKQSEALLGVGDTELRALVSAQKAVVAVAQNDRDEATKLTDAAIALDPQSIEALFARSVVEQSKGAVDDARRTVNAALEAEPKNPALLARAAELAFGGGQNAEAERLANAARMTDPKDTDGAATLGFIRLARGQLVAARELFEEVIQRDSSNAQAYLGLGMARIALGDIDAGRLEIQKAVHLEPTAALYRSYLGKALFEEEREDKADEEFEVAKKLDPLDPTPYLYSSFNNLARFKPVAALRDVEDAIERNDNRAVYRSRLALDQDQATRSTGLGRIFNALDFVNPARIEAQKSLVQDPTNYSAHFLARDSLIGQDIDTAFVAEETIGTLLAPASFSGLLPTVSGGASLNEYTTLFERKQSRTLVDVNLQTKERLGETSLAHFGGGPSSSYLIRFGGAYSDGFRDNDAEHRGSLRVLGQQDLSPDDKILGEFITSGFETGDTTLGINPNVNDPDLELDNQLFSGRFGYRHTFDANSQLLGQVSLVDRRGISRNGLERRTFDVLLQERGVTVDQILDGANFDVFGNTHTKGARGDVLHLWNSQYLSLQTGGSVLGYDEEQTDSAEAPSDEAGIFAPVQFSTRADNNVQAYRGYSYLTLKPLGWAHFVGGANYSNIQQSPRADAPFIDAEYSQTKWSPKVGALLYPRDDVTVRAAYFESLGIASTLDFESLEPSQVAGIRQIFDEGVGAASRNYGAGIDWKARKSTYIGVEYLTRKLISPSFDVNEQLLIDADGNLSGSTQVPQFDGHATERSAVAYVNQVLSDEVVATVDYDWTQSEDDFSRFDFRTHRTQFALNYFHPRGFFAFTSATWRHQDRNFETSPDSNARQDFWLTNAGIGWQLPHRHGSVQLAVRNILDQDFRYGPTRFDERIYPGAEATLGININF